MVKNKLCDERDMADIIELGLVLDGEDAAKFNEYLKHPRDTPKGKKMMKRAERLAKLMKW